MSAIDQPCGPPALASRLNSLFATVTWTDHRGRPRQYTTPQVAKAICDDNSHATTVSRVYLATLRSGANANPTVAMVRAIAKFFDERRPAGSPPITAMQLVGDRDDETDEDRDLRHKLADHQVRQIALRAAGMTPALRHQVLQMLDVLDQPDSTD